MEKVSLLNQKITSETPGHNVGYPPVTNISQRRSYPHQQTTNECYPVQQALVATIKMLIWWLLKGNSVYGSYDVPPHRKQMFVGHHNQQREQQEEQWRRQQMLQQMEQQRQIEQARADKELEELEQLIKEKKRMETSKRSPYQY